MLIELKNLKTLASLSEETHCYTAKIYIDGKPAFDASNHGHGGCDDYRPIAPFTYDDIKRINEWLAANRKPYEAYGTTIECSLEIEVGDLINKELARKTLARMLRSQIVVLVDDKGKEALATYPKRFAPTVENIAKVKARGETVVNNNIALEKRALALV
jgi:hypothetical protein